MNNLIQLNKERKTIDESYFDNYGGGDYSDTYLNYTYHPKNVINQFYSRGIYFNTLLDAGCATGELVRDFRKLGIKAYGIENNLEALKNSVVPNYITYGDIRFLDHIEDNTFEVIYVNSCMYLKPKEILPCLKGFHRICSRAVFLCNPFLGDTKIDSDPYRKFLAKPSWWEKQFKEASFTKISKNIYIKK